jgi:hypothetical protein
MAGVRRSGQGGELRLSTPNPRDGIVIPPLSHVRCAFAEAAPSHRPDFDSACAEFGVQRRQNGYKKIDTLTAGITISFSQMIAAAAANGPGGVQFSGIL